MTTSHPHSSEKERVEVTLDLTYDSVLFFVEALFPEATHKARANAATVISNSAAQSHQSAEADREALRNKFLGPVLFKFGMAIRAVCGKEQGEKLLDKLDPLEQEIMAAVDAYTAALNPPKEEDV